MGEVGLDGRLAAAVRAGDADEVRSLLEAGADPNTDGGDGLPVLCLAVTAYDQQVAAALVEGGADPDRVLPDGTTPLWRAVDGGSPALVSAVLGKEPRLRIARADRERLLDLARGWYETGAAEELRRRTGAQGPATTVVVQDDECDHVDEVSLGGLTVRAGHGAVLTALEWAFRVLTPVDEIIARALRQPDEHHVDWSTGWFVLGQRPTRASWSMVTAHRHHPDPAHRLFVAWFLWSRSVTPPDGGRFAKEDCELIDTWAAQETDGAVLARLFDTFTKHDHPGLEATGLRHADHPDPRVRREVPYILPTDGVPLSPEARTALLTLIRDPDPGVRSSACAIAATFDTPTPEMTRAVLSLVRDPDAAVRAATAAALAASRDHTPPIADALAALLDEEDQLVRLEAAYGLARRDDPRTEEAIERVGPLGPGFDDDHRSWALWRWKQEKDARAAGDDN
ncbi:HEAT repeat domain-containing protein [Streptomyces sp. NPDC048751]|uniref:HEAT repeat domain-containing protein n=1 Tax=Streptomyces sp. NPDC048751 TaxID=3365591 RepID=UPI00371BA235